VLLSITTHADIRLLPCDPCLLIAQSSTIIAPRLIRQNALVGAGLDELADHRPPVNPSHLRVSRVWLVPITLSPKLICPRPAEEQGNQNLPLILLSEIIRASHLNVFGRDLVRDPDHLIFVSATITDHNRRLEAILPWTGSSAAVDFPHVPGRLLSGGRQKHSRRISHVPPSRSAAQSSIDRIVGDDEALVGTGHPSGFARTIGAGLRDKALLCLPDDRPVGRIAPVLSGHCGDSPTRRRRSHPRAARVHRGNDRRVGFPLVWRAKSETTRFNTHLVG